MTKPATSKSERVRALIRTGAKAADIAKQVGCTLGLVYNVKSRMSSAPKRGPGRPRTTSTPVASGLDALIESVRRAAQERARLHGALVRIATIIEQAL